MAIDKKKFLEMMKNPSALSAADVNIEQEDIESDLNQSVENPEKPYSVPAQIKEGIKKVISNKMDAPEIEHETDESTGLPKDEYKSDPEIMEMVKRLSRGESAEKPKEESPEQVAGDSSESIERKKKAIEQIKAKYLGR